MHLTEDQWGKGTLTPRMTTDFDLSLDNSPLLQSIHQLDFVQVKGMLLRLPSQRANSRTHADALGKINIPLMNVIKIWSGFYLIR